MSSLEEEKESELEEVQQELRSAQEEVLMLQQAAEEAAAERENDIASLQEELCRLRVELKRLRDTTAEYELEITTLRAEMSMKSRGMEAPGNPATASMGLSEEKNGTHQFGLCWVCPGEVTQLQEEFISLTDQRQILSSSNKELSNQLEQLQRDV